MMVEEKTKLQETAIDLYQTFRLVGMMSTPGAITGLSDVVELYLNKPDDMETIINEVMRSYEFFEAETAYKTLCSFLEELSRVYNSLMFNIETVDTLFYDDENIELVFR